MKTVVTLGESLIDLVACQPGELADAEQFERAPGGAPANVAAAVARLGGRAAFVGKRGADAFGDCLERTLRGYGVDTRYFMPTHAAKTALAFVSLRPDGERSFIFYRDPSADMLLEPSDVPVEFIAASGIVHVGSVSLAAGPAREATFYAAREAKRRGVWVSFDPNWRPPLWPNPDEGKEVILSMLPCCDMLKVNREELRFLADTDDVEAGAAWFHRQGPRLVFITLDKDGCYYSWQSPDGTDAGYVPGVQVKCVDTTGAGDAFVGAVLFHLARACADAGAIQRELAGWARFAVAASALVTLRKGAIPALPSLAEVVAFAREHGVDLQVP